MVECYTLAIDCLQNPCHYSVTKLFTIILGIIFQLRAPPATSVGGAGKNFRLGVMSERIFIRERRITQPCAERLSSPKGAYLQKLATLANLKN
ncbi:MAG: hypothetical protein ACI9FG_001234 [Crocinitomicaceae bacterium]|jgi:hypothetical protein